MTVLIVGNKYKTAVFHETAILNHNFEACNYSAFFCFFPNFPTLASCLPYSIIMGSKQLGHAAVSLASQATHPAPSKCASCCCCCRRLSCLSNLSNYTHIYLSIQLAQLMERNAELLCFACISRSNILFPLSETRDRARLLLVPIPDDRATAIDGGEVRHNRRRSCNTQVGERISWKVHSAL